MIIKTEKYYGYMSEEINNLINDLSNNYDKLTDIYCLYREENSYRFYLDDPYYLYHKEISDDLIEKSKKYIENMFKSLSEVLNILYDTINEYYNILNKQIYLMSIDEYHELKTLIKETEKHVMNDIKKSNIEKLVITLIKLNKNIEKKRNPEDICKMLKTLPLDFPPGIEDWLILPEAFILEEELII